MGERKKEDGREGGEGKQRDGGWGTQGHIHEPTAWQRGRRRVPHWDRQCTGCAPLLDAHGGLGCWPAAGGSTAVGTASAMGARCLGRAPGTGRACGTGSLGGPTRRWRWVGCDRRTWGGAVP